MVNSPNDSCHSETGLDCQQIEERIHDLLDQRRSPLEDPVVKEHSDHCCQCGDLIADFDAIGDSLLSLSVDVRQRDSNFSPWVLVASISALLLVMLTSNAWLPSDGPEDGIEVASGGLVTPAVSVSEPSGQSFILFGLANDAISPEQLLTTVGFEQIGMQVEPYHEYIGVTAERVTNSTHSLVEPYHEYLGVTAELPGIEPITDSVNLAIQFLSTISRTAADKKPTKSLPDGLNVGLGVPFPANAWA